MEVAGTESATRIRGTFLSSGQGDLGVPTGTIGRQETCVIHAVFMASSWPHRGSGGKSFNKPIKATDPCRSRYRLTTVGVRCSGLGFGAIGERVCLSIRDEVHGCKVRCNDYCLISSLQVLRGWSRQRHLILT